jgi:hypothetical protein
MTLVRLRMRRDRLNRDGTVIGAGPFSTWKHQHMSSALQWHFTFTGFFFLVLFDSSQVLPIF